MGKNWELLKEFWSENITKNIRKISERIGSFITTVLGLSIPVVLYYTAGIIPPVIGTFLYGTWVALVVVTSACIMRIMKNGYHTEDPQ